MPHITIRNSYSTISGLDSRQMEGLRKVLSYEQDVSKAYFSGATRPYTRYLIDAKGSFPTGLLPRVRVFLSKEYGIKSSEDMPFKRPTRRIALRATDSWPVLYRDQVKAANAAIRAHRGGVVMPTGTGKSLVIARIILQLQVKTLIIVPNLEIKAQLRDVLSKLFTDASPISVENVDNPRLKTMTDYDCLILDECHHAAAKTYQKLNKTVWTDIYHRFFLTATYYRNDSSENLLFEGIAGQAVYELSHVDAVSRGYIVPVEAYYVDVPKTETYAYNWHGVYSDLVVNNQGRNETIAHIMNRLVVEDKFVLCLVKEIAHGNAIMKLTGVPFANGQDLASRSLVNAFNRGQIRQLVGTTGILGEGVDTKPAEFVIIAGLGKARGAFVQQIGRGVRRYHDKKSCKIILFRDRSHKFTLRHFNAQKKILLDDIGVKVVKLDAGG